MEEPRGVRAINSGCEAMLVVPSLLRHGSGWPLDVVSILTVLNFRSRFVCPVEIGIDGPLGVRLAFQGFGRT